MNGPSAEGYKEAYKKEYDTLEGMGIWEIAAMCLGTQAQAVPRWNNQEAEILPLCWRSPPDKKLRLPPERFLSGCLLEHCQTSPHSLNHPKPLNSTNRLHLGVCPC